MSERIIALDTETTGLDVKNGHRIIEIGCIEIINRKITSNKFHAYLNPQRTIEVGALVVHGITEEFLTDKPLFADVAHDLIEFVKGSTVIIHNAPFDLSFLNAELGYCRPARDHFHLCCDIIDTLTLARSRHPGQKNSLDALCKRYNVDASQRQLHGALLDAHLLAQMYLAMTGGQGELFTHSSYADNQSMHANVKHVPIDRRTADTLAIHYANSEELAEHEAMLKNMANSGAAPLWEEA